jgi:YggT family protein
MTNPLSEAGIFLVNTLFGLYILAVMLRFLLQWVRADFYNPVSQWLIKLTNPPLLPLRRLIPGWGGVDLAAVVLLVVLQAIALLIVATLGGFQLSLGSLLVLSVAKLLSLLLNIFLVTILIVVILSWVSPGTYHPVTALLSQLTEPVLRPARRLIPPIAGLDLSPLAVLVGIQLLQIVLVKPLLSWGLAVGG